MKTNFKKPDILKSNNDNPQTKIKKSSKKLSKEEFEEFIVKSGAKGSFMVYRSKKQDDELGLHSL